jgi:hypothetical protein
MKNYVFLFFFAAIFFSPAKAQSDSLRGLQTDVMLHPGESFTGYTLQKNEVIVSYSLTSYYHPQPTFISWGITDRLTTEVDITTTFLAGLVDYGYSLNPTFNIRYKLFRGSKRLKALALETNFQNLSWIYEGENHGTAGTSRAGLSASIRLNSSFQVREKLHFHASIGASFNQDFSFYTDTEEEQFALINSPAFSLAADWRPKSWFSTHLALGYGYIPLYMRFTPRNFNAAYSFRFAPFLNQKWGVFRTFRVEIGGFCAYFPRFDAWVGMPVPIIAQLYWQWSFKKKEKKP